MSALICGSLAYDTIMVFPDQFKEHILPDKVHILNVSFLVPEMRREFGGVAGNIAYNLKLLGGTRTRWLPSATTSALISSTWTGWHLDPLCAPHGRRVHPQAFITTDIDDNQITAFHPGAMRHSYLNRVADTEGIRIGIVAPDSKRPCSSTAAISWPPPSRTSSIPARP